MRNTRLVASRLRGIGLAAFLAIAAAGARAQTYTAIDLGAPPGYPDSLPPGFVAGINNQGQVVGTSCNSSVGIICHAFLYSGGNVIDLGTLSGYADSYAYGINNQGQVVGTSCSNDGPDPCRAFLYSGGTMIDLDGLLPADPLRYYSAATGINDSGQVAVVVQTSDVPAGSSYALLYGGGSTIRLDKVLAGYSTATGINNSGQVVGQFGDYAALYSGGGVTELALPDAPDAACVNSSISGATGINNGGQVVGWSIIPGGACHAFLYSGGTMIDLGNLPPGINYSYAYSINSSGEVVGSSYTFAVQGDPAHAFLYSGGTMTDLNSLVSLPAGVYLYSANGINDLGQIAASGSDGHAYLLTSGNSLLKVVNPFAPYASFAQAPPVLYAPDNVPAILNSPKANILAADGESAVVLAFQSKSNAAVTFTVSASGIGLPTGTSVGSLGQFDPTYLYSPSPPGGNSESYQVMAPTSGPDAAGNYTFLALLWAPSAMPAPVSQYLFPSVSLVVSARQPGGTTEQASITVEPPPLLLVHGIWSSAKAAGFASDSPGFSFFQWISTQYPHNLIYPVDYGKKPAPDLGFYAFNDPRIQNILLTTMTSALQGAANAGMSARTVDVVGHSMGGLVTRYFMSTAGYLGNPALLSNPVHKLVTIGTPHQGSPLATLLWQGQALTGAPWVSVFCLYNGISPCTLGALMASQGSVVDTGVLSLTPPSAIPDYDSPLNALSPSNQYSALVGQAPTQPESGTESELTTLIGAFYSGQTDESVLGPANDTIVQATSQSSGATATATVDGIVHEALVLGDVGETAYPPVWNQVLYWLVGGTGPPPTDTAFTAKYARPATTASGPPLMLNLSGYTQVPASNVSYSPTTGSTLTINAAATVTAASSTKVIAETILLQNVTDPTDVPLLYSAQSPFSISYTPTRLGTANFVAIAVFSDNTYAATTLSYTLQLSGTPSALNLLNAPAASMTVGASQVIQTDALFSSGPVDVSQVAAYTAGSGSTNVFSVGSGGTITATGNGVDVLNVSYSGVTATAQIAVGPCTYALNPSNQIVPDTGGTVAIQVTTQPGCAWTATGGTSWLPFAAASGSGSGAVTLTAAANNSGGTEGAMVTVAGVQALVTQPATACKYVLSQTQINALAAGTSGTIGVTTSCPVIASSNATWVTATVLGSSVNYTVAVNNGTSQRTATVTIGTQPVSVVQGGDVTYTISGQVTLSGSGLGGVTMTISGSQNGTATTDGSGNYSFTVLESGTYTVTPSLAGCIFVPPSQPLTNVSTNQTANFVAQVDTSTSVVSSLDPSTYGSAVTFTTTVTPAVGSGTPTGTVTFKNGSATLGTGTLSGGVATLTSTTLPVGANSITAVYGGNASCLASTSAPLSQSVVQATTATMLKSNANPALANQSVTFTATVTGQYGGNPTGTVTFYSNGAQIGSPGTVAARQASITTSFSSPATYSITAVYNGNTNFMPSPPSPALSETIYAPTAVPTTISLKSSGSPSVAGQPVTFTATVKPALGSMPNGESVTFYDGTASIGTGKTASGVATLTTSSLPSGTDPITATYAGDGTYLASTSAVVNQRVNKNTTTTKLSSGLNPSTYGQSVTFTATVSSAGPTPTGTVTFKNGSAALGTGTLSGGVATLAYSKLAAGADSIAAVYGGDTNSLNSTSAPLSQSVTQAATATMVASSKNPSNSGQSVTFTATVTSAYATPTGNVTFTLGSTTLGKATLAAGKARLAVTTLPAGTDTVTATYAATANFSGSTGSISQTVN